MSEEPIVVEFELTPEEWVDVAIEHNRQTPLFEKAVRDGQRAFGLLVVVLGLLGFLAGYEMFTWAWFFAGAVAFAWFMAGLLFGWSRERTPKTVVAPTGATHRA